MSDETTPDAPHRHSWRLKCGPIVWWDENTTLRCEECHTQIRLSPASYEAFVLSGGVVGPPSAEDVARTMEAFRELPRATES